MKTREIILRTLGVTILALGLVLIPLSQAEAVDCSDADPHVAGGYIAGCDWESDPCHTEVEHIIWWPERYTIVHEWYEYVELRRWTEAPQCEEISRECSHSCYKSFPL